MAAFINRAPVGLLGLLDMKSQGENPPQLAETVIGALDLTQLYALQTRALISQASTVTGLGVTAGAFTNLLVPQGELWLVTGLTSHLSAPPLGAAATAQWTVGYVANDTARFVSLAESNAPAIATGADFVSGFDGVYLLQPGDQPTVYVTTQTGGGVGVRLSIVRSRFAI